MPGRIGLWALAIGFGGFAVGRPGTLDEGVPGQGVVAIDTKRKAVQHLEWRYRQKVPRGRGRRGQGRGNC